MTSLDVLYSTSIIKHSRFDRRDKHDRLFIEPHLIRYVRTGNGTENAEAPARPVRTLGWNGKAVKGHDSMFQKKMRPSYGNAPRLIPCTPCTPRQNRDHRPEALHKP